ncbi:hypothetical protein CEXT_801831 [Caerostris extrusa]|uniref:Uncharacterized protein n=1 Tax=Caerostris extrusa TaxID=172846 RepID=A0AAV4X306_CAEEX|nr:hypothetical protein CEXT_801831 [Caerostris extrusa]
MDSTPIPHCGNCPLRDSIPVPFDHLKSRHRPSRKGVRKLNPPLVHNEADNGCDFHLQGIRVPLSVRFEEPTDGNVKMNSECHMDETKKDTIKEPKFRCDIYVCLTYST